MTKPAGRPLVHLTESYEPLINFVGNGVDGWAKLGSRTRLRDSRIFLHPIMEAGGETSSN